METPGPRMLTVRERPARIRKQAQLEIGSAIWHRSPANTAEQEGAPRRSQPRTDGFRPSQCCRAVRLDKVGLTRFRTAPRPTAEGMLHTSRIRYRWGFGAPLP